MLKPLEKSSVVTEGAESRMRCSGKECLVAEPVNASDKTIENIEVLSALHGHLILNKTAKQSDTGGLSSQVSSVGPQTTSDQTSVSTTSIPPITTTASTPPVKTTKSPDTTSIKTTEKFKQSTTTAPPNTEQSTDQPRTVPQTPVSYTTKFVSTIDVLSCLLYTSPSPRDRG